jgi:uncharacterized protein (DUF433 family)
LCVGTLFGRDTVERDDIRAALAFAADRERWLQGDTAA